MKIQELKITITKVSNSIDRFNNRLDIKTELVTCKIGERKYAK